MKIKNILKFKISDFIFNSTRVKVDILWDKEKNKIYKNKKRPHTKFYQKLFYFLIKKDFIFYKYIWKMYILADIKRNCRKSRFI